MITVKIKYLHLLSEVVGAFKKEMKLEEGTTVRELLETHIARHGPEFAKRVYRPVKWQEEPIVAVFVNGRTVNIKEACPLGLDTPLHDGDEVMFGGIAGVA